jgi:hypothetical protein
LYSPNLGVAISEYSTPKNYRYSRLPVGTKAILEICSYLSSLKANLPYRYSGRSCKQYNGIGSYMYIMLFAGVCHSGMCYVQRIRRRANFFAETKQIRKKLHVCKRKTQLRRRRPRLGRNFIRAKCTTPPKFDDR